MTAMHERFLRGEGIVLWKRPLGEMDVIVAFYTRQYGKLRAVAKSARRPTCRFASAVELFTHAAYGFYRKPSKELALLTQHTVRNSFRALRERLDLFVSASYVVELLDHFTPWEAPQLDLWVLVMRTLQGLQEQPERQQVWISFYEVRLLSAAGFHLRVHHCVHCHRPVGEGHGNRDVTLSLARGGVACAVCEPDGADRWILRPPDLAYLQALQCASFQEVSEMAPVMSTVEAVRRLVLPLLHRFSETTREFRTLTVARALALESASTVPVH